MKRNCLPLAALAFVAAMVVAGCGRKEASPTSVSAPSPPPSAPPVVQVTKTVPDEEPGFQAIATLQGALNTEVHARVAGFLIRQDFQQGAAVRPGDLLFEMDARPFEAVLEKAKADLAEKQAHSAPDVDAAQSAVTAAQANIAETKIVAPVGGTVSKTGPGLGTGPGVGAGPGLGDWIGPETLLTTISSVDPIKAVFTLPKKFYLDNSDRIAKVLALAPEARPETIELVLADGTHYSRKGRWESMGRPASASMGPVASALFPNPDRVLRPGDYVKVGEGNP